jgi:hypothetical protein
MEKSITLLRRHSWIHYWAQVRILIQLNNFYFIDLFARMNGRGANSIYLKFLRLLVLIESILSDSCRIWIGTRIIVGRRPSNRWGSVHDLVEKSLCLRLMCIFLERLFQYILLVLSNHQIWQLELCGRRRLYFLGLLKRNIFRWRNLLWNWWR